MNFTDQNGNFMNIEAIKIFKIDELEIILKLLNIKWILIPH